jgi:hypothetical protein
MINYFDNYRNVPNSTFVLDKEIHGSNRRKVPRTSCLIHAHYNINQRLYSSFILDINAAGVCVETDRTFPAGGKILLQYLDPYSKRSTLISGLIAWSSDAAIGVKFNYHLFTPFWCNVVGKMSTKSFFRRYPRLLQKLQSTVNKCSNLIKIK